MIIYPFPVITHIIILEILLLEEILTSYNTKWLSWKYMQTKKSKSCMVNYALYSAHTDWNNIFLLSYNPGPAIREFLHTKALGLFHMEQSFIQCPCLVSSSLSQKNHSKFSYPWLCHHLFCYFTKPGTFLCSSPEITVLLFLLNTIYSIPLISLTTDLIKAE